MRAIEGSPYRPVYAGEGILEMSRRTAVVLAAESVECVIDYMRSGGNVPARAVLDRVRIQ